MVVGDLPGSNMPARASDSLRDVLPKGMVHVVRDEYDGSYTALMWIENPNAGEYQDTQDDRPAQGGGSGSPRPSNSSKRELRRRANRRKALVLIIIAMLFVVPMLSSSVPKLTAERVEMKLGAGQVQGSEFAGGMIEIVSELKDGKSGYTFKFLGTGNCTWYLYCNEEPVYNINQDGNLVKRDFVKVGMGREITVSDSVLHVGSYKLKAVTDQRVYQDDLVVDGKVTTTYRWPFIGPGGTSVYNTIRIEYKFTDVYYYSHSIDALSTSPGRHEYTRIADYAVVDKTGVIDRLIMALGSEYIRHYNPPDSDWYVNYLLSFVQLCIKYPSCFKQPDLYLYGSIDYFAYPLQTIFMGTGDCEDTSILCATLFKAAGYESAVTLVYADSSGNRIIGHSTAAVSVPKLVSNVNVTLGDFAQAQMKGTGSKSDLNYYLCETTIYQQLAVGYIEKKYLDEIRSLGKNVNAIYPVLNG